ncbi:uncharacterized protein ARMOST_22181 [Armillaria ostoyae]|uniref:Uncharacterized protein n=1 Tax=Armillaria ostoyae TaxID=47428 RepID=A0A284SC52_ARMOS|nr:uncharacterized protein ARMOST_22181 [Armillaria ostoyae]
MGYTPMHSAPILFSETFTTEQPLNTFVYDLQRKKRMKGRSSITSLWIHQNLFTGRKIVKDNHPYFANSFRVDLNKPLFASCYNVLSAFLQEGLGGPSSQRSSGITLAVYGRGLRLPE